MRAFRAAQPWHIKATRPVHKAHHSLSTRSSMSRRHSRRLWRSLSWRLGRKLKWRHIKSLSSPRLSAPGGGAMAIPGWLKHRSSAVAQAGAQQGSSRRPLRGLRARWPRKAVGMLSRRGSRRLARHRSCRAGRPPPGPREGGPRRAVEASALCCVGASGNSALRQLERRLAGR